MPCSNGTKNNDNYPHTFIVADEQINSPDNHYNRGRYHKTSISPVEPIWIPTPVFSPSVALLYASNDACAHPKALAKLNSCCFELNVNFAIESATFLSFSEELLF